MCTVRAYLDTNTFLHGRAFHEVPWCDLLDCPQVELVVAVQVWRELDEKKRSRSSREQNRARDSIARLDRFCPPDRDAGHVCDGVTLRVRADAPTIDWNQEGLSPQDYDDCIIAEMLSDGYANAVVVSMDRMLPRKANRHGLGYFILPDEYRVQDEPTDEERENRELRRRLQEFESAAPRLELGFAEKAGPEDYLSVVIEAAEELDIDADTERRIADLHVRRPGRVDDHIAAMHAPLGLGAILLPQPIPSSEYDRYDRELGEYRDVYREHLQDVLAHRHLVARTVVLPLILHNVGSAPAENIAVQLTLPDGFRLVAEDDFPDAPVVPPPPEKPRKPEPFSVDRFMMSSVNPSLRHRYSMPSAQPPPDLPRGPSIKETNSYTVRWDIPHLSHSHQIELDPLYAIFESQQAMASFHFAYWLHCDNHPEAFEGTLHVIIE